MIEVRKKREFERMCYNYAKEMYNSTQHGAVEDRRSRIKQLKEQLMRTAKSQAC